MQGEKELIHEDEDAFMKGVEALHEHQIEAARKMAEQAVLSLQGCIVLI